MVDELFKELQTKKGNWANEEEVRIGWVSALKKALNMDFHAERGKKDLSYNNVIIEFKDRGLFKGKVTSPAFREAIHSRLLPYIVKTAKEQNLDESDYIGIATDAEHISFAQVTNGRIEHGPLLPLSLSSVTMVATAITDNYRRALNAENLIEDFGHSSRAGVNMMQALSNALCGALNKKGTNKTKMLFDEWRTMFGQVADLSYEQEREIDKRLQFTVDVRSPLMTIPVALFVIHTFNCLIIKLLSAEIISAHKLTTHTPFAQNLLVEDDDTLLQRLDGDIERGGFYLHANIKGFVEEALFSWYIDASNAPLTRAIREILVKLSFYRTDNLTQARSKDLLKVFYQNIVPETLRKTLGEFYTPDWLVEFTLEKSGTTDWLKNRTLDPTCGSGSFLIDVIKKKSAAARLARLTPEETIKHITESVWGFDLNPLAVQSARVNYLIHIADLLKQAPGTIIEIPVLLADAVYSPTKEDNDIVTYKIGSKEVDLEIKLPAPIAEDRARLDKVFDVLGECVEKAMPYEETEKKLVSRRALSKEEAKMWLSPIKATYDKVLTLHHADRDGIWFRIIRNFFWSAAAGRFSLVAGNPPWVRWSKLPELYRERVKPTCENYNIFSSTPHHGGNELDISGMITYTVADKWLENGGKLAFVITQTHFQSPSSEGFRDFKINSTDSLIPLGVDDFKELKPFPDAANKTAVVVFKKVVNQKPVYPVPYAVWQNKAGSPKKIPPNYTLREVKDTIVPLQCEANPVTSSKPNSPWAILPIGRFVQMKHLAGKCGWVQGRKGITADLNGVYFVEISEINKSNGQVKVKTRPDAGKIDIGPAKEFWVEPDLLYPLIKGASDFSRGFFHRDHNLYVFVPNTGISKQSYAEAARAVDNLDNTRKYFAAYKPLLESRSTYNGRMRVNNAPYYAIYNVGNYTFAPYKVIWAEQKDFCAAVVSDEQVPLIGRRPFVPDHKLFFVDFDTADPAYYLSGLLNASLVIEWVQSHNISIQIGDIFKHMNLPEYNPQNALHSQMARLARRCQEAADGRKKVLEEISELGGRIIAGA